ncbi:MAG: hypothetical protein KJ698_00345, partial [Actinobacteria bacterium]|nr:hypothetical protein [Actinomycetota bacterium]
MGRISRTIELAKASWQVLKADKELIILPILSLVATMAVAASFLAPILLSGEGTNIEDPGTVGYVLLFVAYVVLAFITIFFNAALVHAANERLDGGDPTIGSALRGAAGRVHRILPWALVSATVSIVLRAIEERAGIVGRIVSGIAGIAWSLVTFLVIPVLVIEDIGVVDAVKRSGAMFKRTWGENMASQVGFGLLGFLAMLPALLIGAAAVAAGGAVAFFGIVVAVLWVLTVAMVLSALSGIFQTALYRYAAGMDTGTAFGSQDLGAAFAPKPGGRTGG